MHTRAAALLSIVVLGRKERLEGVAHVMREPARSDDHLLPIMFREGLLELVEHRQDPPRKSPRRIDTLVAVRCARFLLVHGQVTERRNAQRIEIDVMPAFLAILVPGSEDRV